MKSSIGGRFAAGYIAARTSVASTPLKYGEPREKSRSMIPTAEKRPSVLASSSAANGRNQRTRTKPTFFPSLRISRMATFTGVESVPMPTRTISASSVWYSSKNGFP